jgi:hypothetical protein
MASGICWIIALEKALPIQPFFLRVQLQNQLN